MSESTTTASAPTCNPAQVWKSRCWASSVLPSFIPTSHAYTEPATGVEVFAASDSTHGGLQATVCPLNQITEAPAFPFTIDNFTLSDVLMLCTLSMCVAGALPAPATLAP